MNTSIIKSGFCYCIALAGNACVQENDEIAQGWKYMEEILERIQEPQFPEKDFLITTSTVRWKVGTVMYGSIQGGNRSL